MEPIQAGQEPKVFLPLMALPKDRLSSNDIDTLHSIFSGCVKEPKPSKFKLSDCKKVFIEGQDLLNNFFNGARAARKLVESIRGVTLTATEFFNIFKLTCGLGVISDLLDVKDSVSAAINAKDNLERAAHISGAAGTSLSALGNLWVFISGIEYLRHLDTGFTAFLDKAGPVSWGLSAVALPYQAWKFYLVEKLCDDVKKAKKQRQMGQLSFYQVFLRKDGKDLSTSELLYNLQLNNRIPGLESKYHVKDNIKTIARHYFVTGDMACTNKFAQLVSKQTRTARILLTVKVAALMTSLVAGAFFYFPGLKANPHLGWALLAASAGLSIAHITFNKANSIMWMKELERIAKEAEVHSDEAMEGYLNFLDSLIQNLDDNSKTQDLAEAV